MRISAWSPTTSLRRRMRLIARLNSFGGQGAALSMRQSSAGLPGRQRIALEHPVAIPEGTFGSLRPFDGMVAMVVRPNTLEKKREGAPMSVVRMVARSSAPATMRSWSLRRMAAHALPVRFTQSFWAI